jgi:hypothetical protein
MELTYLLVGALIVVVAAIFLCGGSRGDTKLVRQTACSQAGGPGPTLREAEEP